MAKGKDELIGDDLHDLLIAISVIAKRLAGKVLQNEGEKSNEEKSRHNEDTQ